MNRLVVVDSDTLLFSASAVSETRSIEVTHKPTSAVKEFSNRTEFKELMKSKGKEITDAYQIKDKQVPEPVQNCLHLVKTSADNILERYAFDDVVFVAGDVDNFRLQLPLSTRYKSNRKDSIRPAWLKEAHEYFRNKYKAEKAVGCEADDLVIIKANEGLKQGREVILLSPDKDSRQAIGVKLGDYLTSYENLVHVKSWHDITFVDKDPKSYGVPWMCIQVLKGDPSDGFKPTELAGVKFGDVAVYNTLKDCKTEQECLLRVVQMYKQWYPDKFEYIAWDGQGYEADWKYMLRLYWRCVKMKTHKDDELLADEFFERYGVQL